ncbi:MAG TPA: serine/threonine-protein kinase [Labilithrix sp.]|nr:serine/threonine-protein kinase [Labilithrix sp.]
MAPSRRINKYELVARLARGGQGELFLAVSRGPGDFGHHFVVKRPRTDPEAGFTLEMFRHELSLCERLQHPNIVHTHETGWTADGHYIAMEYLEGQTVSRLLRVVPDLGPEVWAWFAAEALAALGHAHAACDHEGRHLGIVHCDVSPQNVIVTYQGDVKLIDFGIARSAWSRPTAERGALMRGKLRYMAPEQALGRPEARSDIFAVGAVLWEALARRKLFHGDDGAVLDALFGAPTPALSSIVPNVDRGLERIVTAALARDPRARFQCALDMREALLDRVRRAARPVTRGLVASLLEAPFRRLREETRAFVESVSSGRPAESAQVPVTTSQGSHRRCP